MARQNGPKPPQYLGPESGLGWKTRLGIYKEQMDAYNQAQGRLNTIDIEAMREAGAGRRAILQAEGVNEHNAIDRMDKTQRNAIDQIRLSGELGMNALNMQSKQDELGFNSQVMDARSALAGAVPGTPEHEKAMRALQALTGEGQQRPDIRMIEEPIPGDTLGATRQVPIVTNPDGTYTRMQERGGSDPMSYLRNDPEAMAAFSKLSPEEQKKKLELMQKRLQG